MSPELLLLMPISVACDVFGQIFFKIGATGLRPDFPRRLPAGVWIALGLAIYAAEIFVWLRVLSLAPLTVAAPIASLNYLGVILASRWLFNERVAPRQWAGAALVAIGVCAVALTGA